MRQDQYSPGQDLILNGRSFDHLKGLKSDLDGLKCDLDALKSDLDRLKSDLD